jgi:hypothetical protein
MIEMFPSRPTQKISYPVVSEDLDRGGPAEFLTSTCTKRDRPEIVARLPPVSVRDHFEDPRHLLSETLTAVVDWLG